MASACEEPDWIESQLLALPTWAVVVVLAAHVQRVPFVLIISAVATPSAVTDTQSDAVPMRLTTHRHGVIGRAIVSPPLSPARTIVGCFGGHGGPIGAESNAETVWVSLRAAQRGCSFGLDALLDDLGRRGRRLAFFVSPHLEHGR